jgi:hypothetical protein
MATAHPAAPPPRASRSTRLSGGAMTVLVALAGLLIVTWLILGRATPAARV